MWLRPNLVIGISGRNEPQSDIEETQSFFDCLVSTTGSTPKCRVLMGILRNCSWSRESGDDCRVETYLSMALLSHPPQLQYSLSHLFAENRRFA